MSDPLVRVSHAKGMDVVVLDSQANRNALSIRLMEELREQLEHSSGNDSRGLVFDHAGPVFCSGVDLRERRAMTSDTGSHSRLLTRLLVELWDFPKPVICRIAGPVRGGGMGIVAAGDIVVASATAATFAYSEVRVGVAPALVSVLALAKVPLGALLPWLISGEVFDAAAAQRIGLVTRVADDDDVSVDGEVAALGLNGPQAMRSIKALVRQEAGDLSGRIEEMEAVSAALFSEPEALEGVAAFSERRRPGWALA